MFFVHDSITITANNSLKFVDGENRLVFNGTSAVVLKFSDELRWNES